MTIFFGLGNNEQKYLNTKHNIGRVLIEQLANTLNTPFTKSSEYSVAKPSNDFWLSYSLRFMNESGFNLIKLLQYYKIKVEGTTILIIQDDSDQNSGAVKLSFGGGSAGHNGIISCYQHLLSYGFKQEEILRLKIGVRPINNRLKSETFVLCSNQQTDIESCTNLANKIINNQNLIKQKNWNKLQNLVNIKTKIETN
jgi:peptidyl-tRNA hydrolase, PTH1 family